MVNLLPGCGPVAAQRLWSEWLRCGWSERDDLPPKWSDLFLKFKVPKKSLKHWEQLCYTLDELTPEGVFARPSDMIFSILEGLYDEYLKASFDNFEARRGDIEQLSQYGGNFEDIVDFLAQLSLMSSVDGDPNGNSDGEREESDDEKVTLSSIHQSKGLEWEAVFLIWLVDGQFPNGRILESDNLAILEEERRLFYVAVTRAKDELYLTYPMTNPKSYTGEVFCRPSRFLEDFPAEMVEEWEIAVADAWDDNEPF
jgi:DNA helicase-2/ATP-dependent DNA helicase PcrA